jgi:hypothetical protein
VRLVGGLCGRLQLQPLLNTAKKQRGPALLNFDFRLQFTMKNRVAGP